MANLNESRNEWCSRLVSVLSPRIIEGIKSIFSESWQLSVENKEVDKYLMTFQNFLCRVPKWNANIIEAEKVRIIEKSGCNYLEDLITCVHVIQLKVLTCVRVGTRQKKIDISIPRLNDFLHKVYINVASMVYKNAYLFDKSASALAQQKNNREFEKIIEECILKTIRDSIPTEAIVRAYLDESVEQEEEIVEEKIEMPDEPVVEKPLGETALSESAQSENAVSIREQSSQLALPLKEHEVKMPETVPAIVSVDDKPIVSRLTFDDNDHVLHEAGHVEKVNAPKTIERLEEISVSRNLQRKLEEAEEDEDRLKIDGDDIMIDLGFTDLDGSSTTGGNIELDGIEEL